MVWSHVQPVSVFETLVVLFQITGVAALCLSRLFPTSAWSRRGKAAFVVAMVGLGIAGAFCGQHDSEFAMFAGGTMTALLIGMTIGSGAADTTASAREVAGGEAMLAA